MNEFIQIPYGTLEICTICENQNGGSGYVTQYNIFLVQLLTYKAHYFIFLTAK